MFLNNWNMQIVNIIMVLFTSFLSERITEEINKCHKIGKYVVDCRRASLSSIPTCSMLAELNISCSWIQTLILRDNKITDLKPGAFRHFRHLIELDISKNPFYKCGNDSFIGLSNLKTLTISYRITPTFERFQYLEFDSGAFGPLTSLQTLDLSQSWINRVMFYKSACSLSQTVHTIKLNNLGNFGIIENLFRKDLKCFNTLKLRRLDCDHCHIGYVSTGALVTLKTLENINVNYNFVTMDTTGVIGIFGMKNLKYVNLGCQSYHYTCNDVYPWKDWLPNQPVLRKSDLMKNFLRHTVTNVSRYFLPHFHTILAAHMYGSNTIESFCWQNNSVVNIDYSFTGRLNLTGVMGCMWHLKYLNLRGIAVLDFHERAFHEMPSLEVLMIGSAKLPRVNFGHRNASVLFEKNTHLKFLDLSNIGMTKLYSTVFNSLVNIEVLILSHNKLNDISEIQLNFTSVHHIDLSFNDFSDIPFTILKKMEKGITQNSQKKYLRLNQNPFVCTCSNILKIKRMFESKVVIQELHKLNGSLQCIMGNKEHIAMKKAFEILGRQCQTNDKVSVIFVGVLYPIAICFILMICFLYRKQWSLVFAWNLILTVFNAKENKGKQCIFDAFVSYSCKDFRWVHDELIRTLENRDPPYFLCIHDRNFMPGRFITDNIISAVIQSKKTILLITKAFVRSRWCDFESRVAQDYHLGKSNSGIIAIVFPGVYELTNRKPSLRALLNTVTYLEWPKDDRQHVFWIRLCQALGTPIYKAKTEQDIILDDP